MGIGIGIGIGIFIPICLVFILSFTHPALSPPSPPAALPPVSIVCSEIRFSYFIVH